MMSASAPAFGVFGRPSIGKSSIVKALTEDESVGIGPWGGTTTEVADHRLEVEGQRLVIFDTPGFEKPKEALAWLAQRAGGADQRREAIARFLASPECQARYPVETQLLRLIMEGAAILYVADDSRRYGPEYEAEMDMLRWTGQVRVGLLNPFGDRQYAENWRLALRQYFDEVLVFNPVEGDFARKLAIFERLGSIKQEYQDAMQRLVEALKRQRDSRREAALHLLAELLSGLATHRVARQAATKAEADQLRQELEAAYSQEMQRLELDAHLGLLHACNYHQLDYARGDLPLPSRLFDVDDPWLEPLRERLPDWMPGSQPSHEARVGPLDGDKCRPCIDLALDRYLFLFASLQKRSHATQGVLEVRDSGKVAGFAKDLAARLSERQQQRLHRSLDLLCRRWPAPGLRDALRPLLILLMQ